MNWETVSIHIGLINAAAASLISLQAYPEEGSGARALGKIAFYLFLIAALAASFGLALQLVRLQASAPGIYNNLIQTRGLVLAAVLAWFAIGARSGLKMRGITAFMAPAVTITLLLQVFVSPGLPPDTLNTLPPIFLALHIAGATMGQMLAVAASVVSVLYLWQQRALKKKLLTQLAPRLPALDLLEKALVVSLWTGFVFLTVALVTGAVYLPLYADGSGFDYSLKIAWAITVWVWYLAILLARNVIRSSVKRVAQMSLVGFVLLATAFFGLVFFQLGVAGGA